MRTNTPLEKSAEIANPDKFAFEAFNLAFKIQKILGSDLIPKEFKEELAEDYARLRKKVALFTRYEKDPEPAQEMPYRFGSFFEFF